jgi:hypothetical protein
MSKIQKTIHYKRAKISNQSETLQSLLTDALSIAGQTEFANGRIYEKTDNEFELINNNKTLQNCFVGEFIYLEKNKSQEILAQSADTKAFLISSITADSIQQEEDPENPVTSSEFVQAALFFAIKDNDVALLQSRGLNSRHFESHLQWLLIDRTRKLPDNTRISLSDDIPDEAREKIKQSPVRSIFLGTPLESSLKNSDNPDSGYKPDGAAADVVKAYLGDSYFNEKPISSALDDSNLMVEVRVKFKRNTDDQGQDLLSDLSEAFRHEYSNDTVVELKNGGKITAGNLKLTTKISIEIISGRIQNESLYSEMRNWLTENFE